MKENKTLIVAIATVAILIVMFAGVTYAFFTASNNNISASTVAVTGGAMKITYSDGTNDLGGKLTSTDFQPGNDILVDKTFTLVGKNTATADTGLDMEYYIGIQYTSTFSDGQLHWYLKRTDSNSNITSSIIGDVTSIPGTSETGYNHGTFSPSLRYVKLVTGVFKPNQEEQSVTFNLKMQFPDTGVSQDENKGAYFTGKILVNEESSGSVLATGNMIDVLESKYNADDTDLRYDETSDNNLRYVGSDPNNYVSFNNELWRIIGVFDMYDADESGNTLSTHSKKIKLIRAESIGEYAFDVYDDDGYCDGYGCNAWNISNLMKELNGDYLNNSLTSNPMWYGGELFNYSNTDQREFDRNLVIKSSYQNMIADVVWNTGGILNSDGDSETYDIPTINIYNAERSNNVYTGDDVTRTSTWNGKIGLMYWSDYGYSSNDEECRSNLWAGYDVNDSDNHDNFKCKNENWLNIVPEGYGKLYSDENYYFWWTMSSYAEDGVFQFFVASFGFGYHLNALNSLGVLPALYLKSEISITGGTGTKENPFVLSL